MKENDTVNYYHPGDGVRRDATVLEIAGTGGSKKKVLHLQYHEDGQDLKVHDIKHGDDAGEGEAFWLLKKDESAPRGWKDAKPAEDLPEPEAVTPEGSDAPVKGSKKAGK